MTKEQITGAKFIDLLNDKINKEIDQWKQEGTLPADGSADYPAKFGYLKGMIIALASIGDTAQFAIDLKLIKQEFMVVEIEEETKIEVKVLHVFKSEEQAKMYVDKLVLLYGEWWRENTRIVSKLVEL